VLSYTLDKRSVDTRRLVGRARNTVYLYAAEQAFEQFAELLRGSQVIVEGSGSRAFRRELSTRLRRAANARVPGAVRQVRLQMSEQDVLLQLADYCASIAHRHALGDASMDGYHRQLADRWRRIWLIGEEWQAQ
jgi:hypothetical protein